MVNDLAYSHQSTLQRLLLLTTSLALWGTAGLFIQDTAHAQMGPYPPQRGEGYGFRPEERSESVADLQRQLADLGYYTGEITGVYGAQTQDAVSRFQQDAGLPVDGIAGPMTSEALYQGGAFASEQSYNSGGVSQQGVRFNDNGDQIVELQRRLSDLGYFNGEFSGVFDYPTEAAVMQFQRDNGLTPDGVVGPNTESALRRPAAEITRPSNSASPQSTGSSAESYPDQSNGLLQLGDTGQSVSDLQLRLKELGFYQGEVSGVYGPETEAAVISFQNSQGLTTDGIVGPQVNSTLYSYAPSGTSGTIAPDAATAAPNPPTDTTSAAPPASPTVDGASGGTSAFPSPTTSPTAPNATTGNGTAAPSATPNAIPGSTPGTTPTTTSTQTLEQLQQEAELARLEAEQARLEAEQAQLVMYQNLDEGRYSVVSLQRYLRDQGFYSGDVNGIFSTETQDAILEAQRKHGLTTSDLLDASAGASGFQLPQ